MPNCVRRQPDRIVHRQRGEADVGAIEVVEDVADDQQRHQPPADLREHAPLSDGRIGGRRHRGRGHDCGRHFRGDLRDTTVHGHTEARRHRGNTGSAPSLSSPEARLSRRSLGEDGSPGSLRRLDPQHCPWILVGQHIEETVRARPYVADSLMQLGQDGLALDRSSVVERDALNVSGGSRPPLHHRADEHIALPFREGSAGVEGQS